MSLYYRTFVDAGSITHFVDEMGIDKEHIQQIVSTYDRMEGKKFELFYWVDRKSNSQIKAEQS